MCIIFQLDDSKTHNFIRLNTDSINVYEHIRWDIICIIFQVKTTNFKKKTSIASFIVLAQRLLLDDIVVTKTEIAVDFSTIDGCNTESGESTAGDQTHGI